MYECVHQGSLPPAGVSDPEAADRPPPVGGGCLKAPAGAASGGRIKPRAFCLPFGPPLGKLKSPGDKEPSSGGCSGKKVDWCPEKE